MFERAMAASSGGVSPVGVYGAYAKFLWATGGDRAKATDFFEKACAGAAAADAAVAADAAAAADVMATYASFLLVGGGVMTARCEQLLRASLTLQVVEVVVVVVMMIFMMVIACNYCTTASLNVTRAAYSDMLLAAFNPKP